MAAIYNNAYLAIAATASRNSSGGCYRSISQGAYEREFIYGDGCFGNVPATRIDVREEILHFDDRHFGEVRSRESTPT